MRVDKYLKVSRLIKRRSVAHDACEDARIFVNGKEAGATKTRKAAQKGSYRLPLVSPVLMTSRGTVAVEVTYIGNGARKLIERASAGLPLPVSIDEAKQTMVNYYNAYPLEKTSLYPGVAEGLQKLSANGFYLVVVSVSACEAVGHEHVEHVGIGEARSLRSSLFPSLEYVFHVTFFLSDGEAQVHLSRLGTVEVEIDEEVVGRVETHDGVDGRRWVVGGDIGLCDALSIDHQLQLRVLHPSIPVSGVDAVDSGFLFGCTHSHDLCYKGD